MRRETVVGDRENGDAQATDDSEGFSYPPMGVKRRLRDNEVKGCGP